MIQKGKQQAKRSGVTTRSEESKESKARDDSYNDKPMLEICKYLKLKLEGKRWSWSDSWPGVVWVSDRAFVCSCQGNSIVCNLQGTSRACHWVRALSGGNGILHGVLPRGETVRAKSSSMKPDSRLWYDRSHDTFNICCSQSSSDRLQKRTA